MIYYYKISNFFPKKTLYNYKKVFKGKLEIMVSIKAVTSTLAKVVPSDLARTNKRVLTAVKTGWQNGRNSTTSKKFNDKIWGKN